MSTSTRTRSTWYFIRCGVWGVGCGENGIPHPTPDRRGRGAATTLVWRFNWRWRSRYCPTHVLLRVHDSRMHGPGLHAPHVCLCADIFRKCAMSRIPMCAGRKDASVFSSSHKASIAAIDRALPSASCTLIVRTSLDTALEARKLGETRTSRSIAVSSMK